MPSTRRKHLARKELIRMARAAFKAAKGQPVTFAKFLVTSGVTGGSFAKHFAKWTDLLREAGIPHSDAKIQIQIDTGAMLADWGKVARKLGHCPTHGEYRIHGNFCFQTLRYRFGNWPAIYAAFRKFSRGKSEWGDILPLIRNRETELKKQAMQQRPAGKIKARAEIDARPTSGAPIHLDALLHAPVNESGVVFLFGIMARGLGFVVDSLRANFPDCHAKREIRPDVWKPVTIEFEYESRNFLLHRHPVDGCDVIVCWRHNWPECPKGLEVIALSEEIEKIERGKCQPRSGNRAVFFSGAL
jgi:hypothetical protein